MNGTGRVYDCWAWLFVIAKERESIRACGDPGLLTYLLCYLIIGSAGTEIFNIPLQGLLVQGKNGCSFEVLRVMFVV